MFELRIHSDIQLVLLNVLIMLFYFDRVIWSLLFLKISFSLDNVFVHDEIIFSVNWLISTETDAIFSRINGNDLPLSWQNFILTGMYQVNTRSSEVYKAKELKIHF